MVLGSPTLRGTLQVELVDGYTPPLGMVIEPIIRQGTAPQFDQITGLDFGNGTRFDPQYTVAGLTLKVVPH